VNPQIAKLQSLLARVRQNAAALASARAATATSGASAPPQSVEHHSIEPDAIQVESTRRDSSAAASTSVGPASPAVDSTANLPPIQLDAPFDDEAVTVPPAARGRAMRGDGIGSTPVSPDVGEPDSPPLSTRQPIADEDEPMPDSSELEEVDSIDGVEDLDDQAPRTPPPESGPQVSAPPPARSPELDTTESVATPETGPTMAQLGTTVELEGSEEPGDLELVGPGRDERIVVDTSSDQDSYEVELPGSAFSGGYDASLEPPPEALDDLKAHDVAQQQRQERLSMGPATTRAEPPDSTPTRVAGGPPIDRVSRQPVSASTNPAQYEGQRPSNSRSFGELLQASLNLKAR
jgi:hypothetical protein